MRPCFNTLTIIEFSHCCIQAAMTSPGLWPALVATAGGDLAVLLQHLHTLHRVTCPHLQLAEVMSLCSTAAAHTFLISGWAPLAKHPEKTSMSLGLTWMDPSLLLMMFSPDEDINQPLLVVLHLRTYNIINREKLPLITDLWHLLSLTNSYFLKYNNNF